MVKKLYLDTSIMLSRKVSSMGMEGKKPIKFNNRPCFEIEVVDPDVDVENDSNEDITYVTIVGESFPMMITDEHYKLYVYEGIEE